MITSGRAPVVVGAEEVAATYPHTCAIVLRTPHHHPHQVGRKMVRWEVPVSSGEITGRVPELASVAATIEDTETEMTVGGVVGMAAVAALTSASVTVVA